MKRYLILVSVLLTFALSCWAQEEARHEFIVQGSGFFGKKTNASGIHNDPTNSGGFLAGYRFNINKWLAVEGDYDFFSNSQKYIVSSGPLATKTYTHGVTGAGVIKLPTFRTMKPFLLAGGGALVFEPRDTAGVERQTRGALVYGGGADFAVVKHILVRAQYRGFIYKVPDYGISQLNPDKYTHAAVPSAGLVFTF